MWSKKGSLYNTITMDTGMCKYLQLTMHKSFKPESCSKILQMHLYSFLKRVQKIHVHVCANIKFVIFEELCTMSVRQGGRLPGHYISFWSASKNVVRWFLWHYDPSMLPLNGNSVHTGRIDASAALDISRPNQWKPRGYPQFSASSRTSFPIFNFSNFRSTAKYQSLSFLMSF